MNFEQIKHSVILITHNQENYIYLALNSVLEQDPMPYEIIIGDDASTDNTSKIVIDYQNKYPAIIKVYRHAENLGINKNLNFLMNLVNGDIVTFLAGDDLLKPDIFKELNNVVKDNNVNLEDDFILVTNTSILYPDGKEVIWNNYRYKHLSAFKQTLRYSLDYRCVGISNSLLRKISPYREDIGYQADWIWGLELNSKCKKHYYTPFVSSIYRVGVGVTTLNDKNIMLKSRLKVLSEIEVIYSNTLDRKDISFLALDRSFINYRLKPNLRNYAMFLFLLLNNIDNINRNCYLKKIYHIMPIFLLKRLIWFKSRFRALIKRQNLTLASHISIA